VIQGRPIKYTGRPDPYDRLVLAVLARAAKDLRTPYRQKLRYDALLWLNSREVRELAATFGVQIPPVSELREISKENVR
jgi:hypothetical protein